MRMYFHPIRLTGMVVGVQQSFDYLEKMQDRVVNFITAHSHISAHEFKRLMMTTGELARDVGTVVVGKGAVDCGLIDEVGGLDAAMSYLRSRIEQNGRIEGGKEPKTDDLEHYPRKRNFQRRSTRGTTETD